MLSRSSCRWLLAGLFVAGTAAACNAILGFEPGEGRPPQTSSATGGSGGAADAGGVGGAAGAGGQPLGRPRASRNQSFGSTLTDKLGGLGWSAEGTVIAGTHNADITIGQLLPNSGGTNVFLANLDAYLLPQWSRSYATAGSIELGALAVDATGSTRFAGSTDSAVDFGAGPLTPVDGADLFFARFGASGAQAASQMWPQNGVQLAHTVRIGTGGTLVGGQFNTALNLGAGTQTEMIATGYDGFVALLDDAGGLV